MEKEGAGERRNKRQGRKHDRNNIVADGGRGEAKEGLIEEAKFTEKRKHKKKKQLKEGMNRREKNNKEENIIEGISWLVEGTEKWKREGE